MTAPGGWQDAAEWPGSLPGDLLMGTVFGMVPADDITEPVGNSFPGEDRSAEWPTHARWFGVLIAALGLGLLVTAVALPPASAGLGTHKQLGLPSCNWITTMDLPCPTCGMTTAFSHTVRGEWPSAFRAQPMGLLLCLVAAMAVIGGTWTALVGNGPGRLIATSWNRWWTWPLVILVVAAWGWKIAVYRGVF